MVACMCLHVNSNMLLNQERKCLLFLKHPCVVQLLATSGNPQSPVLLIERMWMSLTQFLTTKELHHNKIYLVFYMMQYVDYSTYMRKALFIVT